MKNRWRLDINIASGYRHRGRHYNPTTGRAGFM
jgi:hypothetical protein